MAFELFTCSIEPGRGGIVVRRLELNSYVLRFADQSSLITLDFTIAALRRAGKCRVANDNRAPAIKLAA